MIGSRLMSRINRALILGVIMSLLFATHGIAKDTSYVRPSPAIVESDNMIVIRGQVSYREVITFDKEVTIYPEAYISTTGSGKIIFNKRVNVLGSSQVFDTQAQIKFSEGCIGTLNVAWFGAKGYDKGDDTRSFQKALGIASGLSNVVNIFVPIGQYYITEQLVLENTPSLNKPINLIGEGMSSSTNDGSSLIWNGNTGASMILVRNNYHNLIQSLDFAAEPGHELKHNIELRSQIYLMEIKDCSFSGSAGLGSANVNLNDGSSSQVSEISFRNCAFRGKTVDNVTWMTGSAVKGGKANTKNFYFEKCSFLGYNEAAINIEISDIVDIRNCTFSLNELDISCLLCGLLATSNYSEQSKSFLKGTNSDNLAFTTLVNNFFDGHPAEDFVITGGSGSLVIINNDFGGNGGIDSTNLIRWDSRNISSVYSVGNFFRNGTSATNPFVLSGRNAIDPDVFKSQMDKIGADGTTSRKIDD